jgi:hypothetical protein
LPSDKLDKVFCSRPIQFEDENTLPPIITQQLQRLDEAQQIKASCMLQKFSGVLNGSLLGRSSIVQHSIELTDDKPLKQMPRRVSAAQRDIINAEIEIMKNQGIIRPSCSPWATPVVLVTKKDGGVRFCIDFRSLNEKTKSDAYPLPHPVDILDSMNGASWFCTLDLKSGFWQIEMKEEHIEKTAFCVPGGHYEFLRMPFGLKNATATFQRAMEKVLSGLLWQGVGVFVDDIVVYGDSFEQVLERLREVLSRLEIAGLTLSSKKCFLFQREVKLLGHVISENGILPDPEKLKTVSEWVTPRNQRQVREFLGLATYYRKFVHNFAHIASPLHALTSPKSEWMWSDIQQQAFEKLRQLLTQPPILSYFSDKLPIVIDCDASDSAIGAILAQIHPEGEKVVAYYSRCLSAPEKNYCVTRKELLAVLESLKHWKHYVHGHDIIIRSDHSALS